MKAMISNTGYTPHQTNDPEPKKWSQQVNTVLSTNH